MGTRRRKLTAAQVGASVHGDAAEGSSSDAVDGEVVAQKPASPPDLTRIGERR
jgi:hypothetical protein